MKKTVKVVNIVLFGISVAFLLMSAFGILLFLGPNPVHNYMMGLGYYGTLIFSALCVFRFKYKFFVAALISLSFFVAGIILDANFWKTHNNQLCEALRADRTCVESGLWF